MCFFDYQQELIVAREKGNMRADGVCMVGWEDLPVELIISVLSLVDDRTIIMASGVCTGWRDAISLGLTELSMTWCKDHMNNLMLSLSPKLANLQVLNLRQNKPQVQDNAFEAIARYCHDLRDLDLSKCVKLSDRSLFALARGCPHLAKLNISGCPALSDSALAYLTSFCKGLKNLNLCGCVQAASDRSLRAIAYNCKQLESLNLGWCENVSDKGVTSLAIGCPDLRALDLCGCVLITDETVVALSNNCPHLRSLGLYYCQNITDKAMYSLASSLIKSMHDQWSSSCSYHEEEGLRSLNVSQCTALTAPAVQAVCDSFPALHTCPGMHSLLISGCLSLTSVHCACRGRRRRSESALTYHHAY